MAFSRLVFHPVYFQLVYKATLFLYTQIQNHACLETKKSKLKITSVSKKLGQSAVVYYYCALSQFFETDVTISCVQMFQPIITQVNFKQLCDWLI